MRAILGFFSLAVCLTAQNVITFNDDGGWCWFQDERVIVAGDKLVIGSVAAGVREPGRKGDVEITVYDLASRKTSRATLHRGGAAAGRTNWLDDHNTPALLARPDGRILAVYTQHGEEATIYSRISAANDPTAWGEERKIVPSPSSRVTYSNLHWLSGEKRVYDFYRGFDGSNKPSWIWSDDQGATWKTGRILIDVPSTFKHRPYVKYASDGRDTIHMAYTDGHPRDFDNSVYHIYYRGGKLYHSDGSEIRSLQEGLKRPEEGTRIFQGDPNNVGWTSDLHLDQQGRPRLVYSVQKDSAGLASGKAGEDLRYRYARWDGKRWIDHEIAHAGSKLYAGEDDYTGNICIDPQDPTTVFISANADPVTGKRLPHWEIYRGTSRDEGASFTWTPVTHDSAVDNIRPIVPVWRKGRRALLWLRGHMRTFRDYDFQIVGTVD